MLSQDLNSLAVHLGEMAIVAPEEFGKRLDVIREHLFSIASQVRRMEACCTPLILTSGDEPLEVCGS
jgi:hypothetical protein